jgi:hypothetical protein
VHLPFPDGRFDDVTCIDAINYLQDREHVIADWKRVLKPGGRLLFTDPIIVTGALSNAEIAVRSSIGFFLFGPAGYDDQVLAKCDLRVVVKEDVTSNMAKVAERRRTARASRGQALREIEGVETYDGQQEFLGVAARVAQERRLSRFAYVSEKFELSRPRASVSFLIPGHEPDPFFTVATISPRATRAEISSPGRTCAASFTSFPDESNTKAYPLSKIATGDSASIWLVIRSSRDRRRSNKLRATAPIAATFASNSCRIPVKTRRRS